MTGLPGATEAGCLHLGFEIISIPVEQSNTWKGSFFLKGKKKTKTQKCDPNIEKEKHTHTQKKKTSG